MENDEPPVSPRMISVCVYGFLVAGAVSAFLMHDRSNPFGLRPLTNLIICLAYLGAAGVAFHAVRPALNSREISDSLRTWEGKLVVACFLLGALANLIAICSFAFIR